MPSSTNIKNKFRRNFRLILAVLIISFCNIISVKADESSYRGFVATFEPTNFMEKEIALKSFQRQVDIVYEVGLTEETLSFLKTLPITLIIGNSAEKNHFSKSDGVVLNAKKLSAQKPILLHEFLHSFYNAKIRNNKKMLHDINAFYEEGLRVAAYDTSSHSFKNPNEFFACSGTAILFKEIYQEPFLRSKVKQNQPQYFEWFLKQMGMRDESLIAN